MQQNDTAKTARANIRRALELRNKSSFDLSVTLGKHRTYLDDYLRERKQSISTLFARQLATSLELDFEYVLGDKILTDEELVSLSRLQKRAADLQVIYREIARTESSIMKLVENKSELPGDSSVNDRVLEELLLKKNSLESRLDTNISFQALEQEQQDFWRFPDTLVRDQLRARHSDIDLLLLKDSSMTRENGTGFNSGDHVIIHKTVFDLRLGGVFLIRDRLSSFIRQLELVGAGPPERIRCQAFNKDYPSFELLLDEDARVVGKVVATIKLL